MTAQTKAVRTSYHYLKMIYRCAGKYGTKRKSEIDSSIFDDNTSDKIHYLADHSTHSAREIARHLILTYLV